VVAVGALVDGLAWHVVPFHTIDVLYLIGVSIPFVYAATRLKAKGMAIGACVIFALAPILQLAIGYGAYPLEPLFDGTYTVSPEETTGVLQHWFIDGWFPLVPWFGFALAGGALGAYQSDKMEDVLPKFGSIEIVGVTMIGVGGIAWFLYPGAMYSREGFSELFYPPVPGFLLAATGFTIVLLYLARFTQSWAGYSPLRALGEASLFMYVIHSIFIGRVVFEHFEGLTHIEGLGIFAGMIIVMIGLGYGIRRLKKLPQSRHPALRFVLGG
ncbi:MAG: heparan-alpha-glucosaminide N-acetyltransferase domain-containing protein, partial [Phycisphaerae bacterium]|nr:heparan-alpha-glucosaminide N-acetyltransferase domain-containing protein [Phycisphaerae bacterium]